MFQPIIERIESLTDDDLQRKTPLQLALSSIEELGEVAREVKIVEKVPGNAHKKLDEGVACEAADLFICAICISRLPDTEGDDIRKTPSDACLSLFPHDTEPQLSIFELLGEAAIYLGETFNCKHHYATKQSYALRLAQTAIDMFLRYETIDKFAQICHSKLDKWEKTKG